MNDTPTPVLVCCLQCDGPVLSNAAACTACGMAPTGKEFPYILQQPVTPDIAGMCKWWAIWCVGVWALAGFSLGIVSSLLVTAVSAVYLFRILRAYYR